MNVTLALIGPHGAGKSTLGRTLAERLGWAFHGEIGELLAYGEGREELEDAPLPYQRRGGFDEQVTRLEVQRDLHWVGGSRVVETWHPGNLAYATVRNPAEAQRLVPWACRAAQGAPGVLVLPVRASADVLARRCREPGEVDQLGAFFGRVAATAEALAREWGLTVLPPVDTSCRPLDDCVDGVLSALRG